MLVEAWVTQYWWLALIVLPLLFLRQIVNALTAPRDALKLVKDWRANNQPITLQYNRVEAILSAPNKKRFMEVDVRAFLDNPHGFTIRHRAISLVTTLDWLMTSDMSHLKREDVIGAGARNQAVEVGGAVIQLRPGQDSFPIRLIWEFEYWRDDNPKVKCAKPLRIIGTLTVRQYANGLWESRWKEEDYGDPPVNDYEDAQVIEGPDGEAQIRRKR